MDEVLRAIGAFFATFQPNDWVTAALAVIAVGISIYNLAQRGRYHPKPLWVDESQTNANDDWWGVTARNQGNAPAHDVKVTLTHKNGSTYEVSQDGKVDPGDDAGGAVNVKGAKPKDAVALITWRQSPNMKKVRKHRLHPQRREDEKQESPFERDLGIY